MESKYTRFHILIKYLATAFAVEVKIESIYSKNVEENDE